MVKKARPKANKMIDRFVLVNIYKIFKKNPLTVFIAKDFGTSSPNKFREKYLNTLKSFSLIEEVPTVYQCGNKLKVRRTVKGYKLLK